MVYWYAIAKGQRKVKRIDPEMRLDGFRLKDALESIYCSIAAALRRLGAADSPDLYKRAIPQMVFDVAIGAGWIPLSQNHFDPKVGTAKGDVVWEADFQITNKLGLPKWILDNIDKAPKEKNWRPPHKTTLTKNQAQRIVQFGEWYVERTYVDSFYDLLREPISFHLAEGTEHEEQLKKLPTTTKPAERKRLLEKYISKEGSRGYDITKKQVAERAGVDYSVLAKWLRDDIKDGKTPADRIMLLLLFDERNRARTYRAGAMRSGRQRPKSNHSEE
jgi:hypothetical protein